MSHVKTNKLSARTASGTITLGESGETITVPSGATLSGAGAITVPSGGSLTIDSGATITNNGTSTGFTSSTAAGEVKAWCYFNGTGTIAINASSNVSSLTDNGVGNYSINLITAMANSNYVYAGSVNRGSTVGVLDSGGTAATNRSASSPRINTWYVTEVQADFSEILVTFFNT
jgi:hypothetical protein